MRIDAQVFFWKYEKDTDNPLILENQLMKQHYLPEQIAQSLHRNGINGCIAVAAEDKEVETRFLSELALTHPEIYAVIGWLNLSDSAASDKINEFSQYKAVRGYRIVINKTQFPEPVILEILHSFQYCLDISLGAEFDLAALSDRISANRDQVFILYDCGKPDARQAPSKTWEATIRSLARNQNLSCKLSGLFTTGNRKNWKPADFYPFLEILFDSFGSDRLLFASDWPLLLVSGLYVQWKSLLEKFMEKYTGEEHDKIFGENAARLYRI